MSAIAVHHTDTTDAAWDGPANKARIPGDASASVLRSAFAWIDSESDPETTQAYKFIHHMVAGDGSVGAANIVACQAGVGVLNGARLGTTIPDADRPGVFRHLAAHLRDAGVEPPELKSFQDVERRAFPLSEIRISTEGEPSIRGHAAVFDQPSEDFGFFRERVSPGAFKKTLREGDVRALFNHNPDFVLGRNRAGTLSLAEDRRGLAIEAQPPDTQWARDLMTSMRRGDINQMSFGFQTIKDSWETDPISNETIRTLLEVRLFDVSVVTFPAYPQTDVSARSALASVGIDVEDLIRAIARRDRLLLRAAIDVLGSYLPPEPATRHSEPGEPATRHSLALMRRRLELAAATL